MNNLTYPAYTDSADIEPINENFRILASAAADAESHAAKTNNPHGVNKNDVGLGNVLNVEQASKADLLKHINQTGLHNNVVFGTYKGNSENVRTIPLASTPVAVIVHPLNLGIVATSFNKSTSLLTQTFYSGIALNGFPYTTEVNASANSVTIVKNGFNVRSYFSGDTRFDTNNSSLRYLYIAFMSGQITEVEE